MIGEKVFPVCPATQLPGRMDSSATARARQLSSSYHRMPAFGKTFCTTSLNEGWAWSTIVTYFQYRSVNLLNGYFS